MSKLVNGIRVYDCSLCEDSRFMTVFSYIDKSGEKMGGRTRAQYSRIMSEGLEITWTGAFPCNRCNERQNAYWMDKVQAGKLG